METVLLNLSAAFVMWILPWIIGWFLFLHALKAIVNIVKGPLT